MALLIDRTDEDSDTYESRRRFIEKVRHLIQQDLKNNPVQSIQTGLDKDVVSIDENEVSEPFFVYDPGSVTRHVCVKNLAFNKGDSIDMQTDKRLNEIIQAQQDEDGEGQGGDKQGIQLDKNKFTFKLTDSEYASILFEGFELPNFAEKASEIIPSKKLKKAGIVKNGLQSNLHIVKSYKESLGRRIATKSAILEQIETLKALILQKVEIDVNNKLLAEQEERLENIPFFDECDLRYNSKTVQHHKITRAVIFLVLDVSGSMDQYMLELAKRLFFMFHLFVKMHYEHIDTVFIVHTDEAKEVSEQEFFYTNYSGGTELVPVCELVHKIITERYDTSKYNIYYSHVTDCDYWDIGDEIVTTFKKLIIPNIQYGFLSSVYKGPSIYSRKIKHLQIGLDSKNFKVVSLEEKEDCYLVLKKLFLAKR